MQLMTSKSSKNTVFYLICQIYLKYILINGEQVPFLRKII